MIIYDITGTPPSKRVYQEANMATVEGLLLLKGKVKD